MQQWKHDPKLKLKRIGKQMQSVELDMEMEREIKTTKITAVVKLKKEAKKGEKNIRRLE